MPNIFFRRCSHLLASFLLSEPEKVVHMLLLGQTVGGRDHLLAPRLGAALADLALASLRHSLNLTVEEVDQSLAELDVEMFVDQLHVLSDVAHTSLAKSADPPQCLLRIPLRFQASVHYQRDSGAWRPEIGAAHYLRVIYDQDPERFADPTLVDLAEQLG